MRTSLLLAGVLLLGAAPLATPLAAQRQVTRGWPLDPDGAVKIHNYVGRVRIVGWDRDSVAVTGTVPARLALFGGGDRSGVKLAVDGEQRGAADSAVLEVRVPAGADVWVRGAATDIEVHGLIGTVDVGTVGGRVLVAGSPRNLTAETMEGALTIHGSPETLRAKTAGGPLEWEGRASEAHLVSVSGRIHVTGGPFERARIESITGAVRVQGSLRTDGRLTIETHSGQVDLHLPRNAPVRLDVDAASVSGTGIVTRVRPAGGTPGGAQEFAFNLGKPPAPAPHVTVRSFKGAFVLAFSP